MNPYNKLKIQQLDDKFRFFKDVEIPKNGWVNLIRKTLGFTYAQLSKRLNTSPQVIKKFEQNEVKGSVTINTMRKLADAMDCNLVYALVPKSSLSQIIEDRADMVADSVMNRVSNTMYLESQLPGNVFMQKQKEELKQELKKNLKKLWDYEV